MSNNVEELGKTVSLITTFQSQFLASKYRSQIYDLPDDKKINYRYDYEHISTVNLRLLQAGIRLAGILEEIYG